MSPASSPAGWMVERDDGGVALLGSSCQECRQPSFPRADICCWCGGADPAPVELSGTGNLWGWAVVHTAPPGYFGPVPYGMGVVELPEGVRIITRVDITDEPALAFGQPMRFVAVTLPTAEGVPETDTLVTWCATPC